MEKMFIGPKSFGDGRQDICKDKASNLGPAAG